MTALLDFCPLLLLIAGLGWGYWQRLAGAKAERAKQDAERLKARTVADEIDDAVAGREPSENRERLKRW